MRRIVDMPPPTAEAGQVDRLLWAIVDRQAPLGAHRRVRRLLGSDAAARSALREFAAIDRSLRAWCEGRPADIRPADRPDRSAYPARTAVAPALGTAEPSGVVGA